MSEIWNDVRVAIVDASDPSITQNWGHRLHDLAPHKSIMSSWLWSAAAIVWSRVASNRIVSPSESCRDIGIPAITRLLIHNIKACLVDWLCPYPCNVAVISFSSRALAIPTLCRLSSFRFLSIQTPATPRYFGIWLGRVWNTAQNRQEAMGYVYFLFLSPLYSLRGHGRSHRIRESSQ